MATTKVKTPSIQKQLPYEVYRAQPGLNASVIVPVLTSPKHGRWRHINPPDPTAIMRWGNIVHTSTLEPHLIQQDFAILETPSKTLKAWKDFVKENPDKTCITSSEAEDLANLSNAVWSNERAASLLTESDKEVSLFWRGKGYGEAKARLDALSPNAITDLKTTGDINNFKNIAARMRYETRMGWYQVGVEQLTGVLLPVYIIAVEAKPPYDQIVYEYDEEALAIGRDAARGAATLYRQCEKTGLFPGICDEVRTLRLPDWMTEGDEPMALKAGGVPVPLGELDEMEASEL